jgi:hypothetical protein
MSALGAAQAQAGYSMKLTSVRTSRTGETAAGSEDAWDRPSLRNDGTRRRVSRRHAQAIKLVDAEGRSCIYVPITQDGKVVDSQGYILDLEHEDA